MQCTPNTIAPHNPNQATTIGNLVTFSQLYWLDVAAKAIGADKDIAALDLFNCPVASLSREAAEKLLQHFARMKDGQ